MTAVRFIHTADWQMGMRAAHVGAAGARVRAARLESARQVARLAHERGAQFILVAGDTFEDNGVDRVLVQQVADILASAAVPVYLIPGNHDPLVPGSVWEHPAWAGHANLHVLRECRPVAIPATGGADTAPAATLFPSPLFAKYSPDDPTAWISAAPTPGDGIRIGLAHGTVQGAPIDAEPDYPIPRDAARLRGLDYLALGHWHSYATYPDASGGAPRMAYSGTHETTKFGERDSGNVLLVEIAAPGAPPVITSVRTGMLTWTVMEPSVTAPGDLERLLEKLEAMPAPDATLLDLRPSGLLDPADAPALDRLRTLLPARFLHSRLDLASLYPAPAEGDSSWLESLPPGVARSIALHLTTLAARPSSPPDDPDHPSPNFAQPPDATPQTPAPTSQPSTPSPAVAVRALRELYLLTREGAAS